MRSECKHEFGESVELPVHSSNTRRITQRTCGLCGHRAISVLRVSAVEKMLVSFTLKNEDE